MTATEGDLIHIVRQDEISSARRDTGRWLFRAASLLLALTVALQVLDGAGLIAIGFENWRPTLYAYLLWGTALCADQVLRRGELGVRNLFILPAALFTVAMVIFPLAFGVTIALSDWNLSSLEGRKFNGVDNFVQMWGDPFFWNALKNMVYYVAAISVEYVIAFGLALLLSMQIRARKFFRVVFLIPLMLSPVALSWMVGKSMMEPRFGPIARLARELGWQKPAFFSDPEIARATIMILDAWTWIPLMMVILLAGLQALPKDVMEAAAVDGATPWQRFWRIIFPMMLPVSITAVIIRIIFKLKLADIVITVTSGGPGGATDTVTSFIFREYRDRSNVGYGTLLAFVYLVLIVIFITVLLNMARRWTKPIN